MTFAELERYAESKARVKTLEAKERATMDYLQAIVIGKAVLSAFDSKNEIPKIHEVYPSLFDEGNQEDLTEQQDLLSALRFKQFAQSFNDNYYKEEASGK